MLLRKINAGVSLLTTALLLCHAVSHALWMLSGGNLDVTVDILSWVLFGAMILHALISIDLAISGHTDGGSHKHKSYPKMNIPTMVQRVSGVLLILFAILHVAGTAGPLKPPPVVHAILPPLFFAVALAHTAVSAGKAFITLGIGNAKAVKVIDIVVKVVCTVTLAADVTGFYLYLA